jgi:DNA invertase Pin-like site-specific DNA recombinase
MRLRRFGQVIDCVFLIHASVGRWARTVTTLRLNVSRQTLRRPVQTRLFGYRLKVPKAGHNQEDYADTLRLEGILSTIAQFENDDKAERTKRGMKAALERGTWPFPTSLGYLKFRNQTDAANIIQDPKVAPLIKQAFEMFATGSS